LATDSGPDLVDRGGLWSMVARLGAVGSGSKGGEPVFLGTHHPRLDDKGRLFLPAKFRDEMSGGLVMTKGQERCLYVFPRAEFNRFTEQMHAAPWANKDVRDYLRVFLSGASDDVPDRQGRVTVPAPLREYAQLSKECVVIGAGARLEIWDATTWTTYLAVQEPSFAERAEEVLPGFL